MTSVGDFAKGATLSSLTSRLFGSHISTLVLKLVDLLFLLWARPSCNTFVSDASWSCVVPSPILAYREVFASRATSLSLLRNMDYFFTVTPSTSLLLSPPLLMSLCCCYCQYPAAGELGGVTGSSLYIRLTQ
jgi:hypothetical protein